MTPDNFIDAHIPNWQLSMADKHCIQIDASIVYRLDLTRKDFETSARSLARRQKALLNTLKRNGTRKRHLTLIDTQAITDARSSVTSSLGENYLEHFISDTSELAFGELKEVLQLARHLNVIVTPHEAGKIISIRPGRSFNSQTALNAHCERKGQDWIPVVRLQWELVLEGTRSNVETTAAKARNAMLTCGPLANFTETASPLRFNAEHETSFRLIAK